VCIAGIVSASVVPDTYQQTKHDMAKVEALGIPASGLGAWLKEQHLLRLKTLLAENGYDHILRKYHSSEDMMEWYEGELARLSEQLRDNLDTPKEKFYRQEMDAFRRKFHKPVIYSDWDWDCTVQDALHQAGFKSFEEQAEALARQREKSW
jgi:pyruvate,water dikinase